MRRNMIETVMGAVVLLVAVAFIVVAFRSASLSSAGRDGYQVTVEFSDASGLAAGTDVRLAGVKIGTVMEQRLNPETYFAVVTLGVSNAVRLPSDTSARIIPDRSEEHTSELQSLMRISYAVFCLNKKKQ